MRIPGVEWRWLVGVALAGYLSANPAGADDHRPPRKEDTVLYVWASDQARVGPDFLAVVNFDQESADYGKVIGTVPIPPPGNVGNEAHHCHLSADKQILGCGGLLSVLNGQNGIFFFDVSDKYHPRFLFSTSAAAVEHHRRLPASRPRRVPHHSDGLGDGRRTRPRGRVRSQPSPRGEPLRRFHSPSRVAEGAPARRVQPPRHQRAARPQPDADRGLHPPRQHVERGGRAIRSCEGRSGCGTSRAGGSSTPYPSTARSARWTSSSSPTTPAVSPSPLGCSTDTST